MEKLNLKIIGCGDAFGSGGRLNTCFLLEWEGKRLLIDCGATSLPGLKKLDLGGGDLDAIVISHFHGDHFGGVPFLLMDAAYAANPRPLQLLTPAGGKEKIETLLNLLYPGSDPLARLDVTFTTYQPGARLSGDFYTLESWAVHHTAASQPHGLRIDMGGKIISYSGDTSWTPALSALSNGADLFICECNFYDTAVEGHLHFTELQRRMPELNCKSMLLTHMGPDMLERQLTGFQKAVDGMELLI